MEVELLYKIELFKEYIAQGKSKEWIETRVALLFKLGYLTEEERINILALLVKEE